MSQSKALLRKLPTGGFKVNKENVIAEIKRRRESKRIARLTQETLARGLFPATRNDVDEELELMTAAKANNRLNLDEN